MGSTICTVYVYAHLCSDRYNIQSEYTSVNSSKTMHCNLKGPKQGIKWDTVYTVGSGSNK